MTVTDIVCSGGSLMRVFVTGASGWIGSAVVPELIGAGQRVLGLARSDSSAAAIEAAGAEVLRGDLTDLDTLRTGAASTDGVIHLAFIHDFTDFAAAIGADRNAIEAMGAVLEGSGKPLVIASGTPAVPGHVATEGDESASGTMMAGRVANAHAAPARRSWGCPARCTATVIVTASSPAWSALPGTRASPATSATGPTAGPLCTCWTPRTCSAWLWSRPQRDRGCTRSATRACRSSRSPG